MRKKKNPKGRGGKKKDFAKKYTPLNHCFMGKISVLWKQMRHVCHFTDLVMLVGLPNLATVQENRKFLLRNGFTQWLINNSVNVFRKIHIIT